MTVMKAAGGFLEMSSSILLSSGGAEKRRRNGKSLQRNTVMLASAARHQSWTSCLPVCPSPVCVCVCERNVAPPGDQRFTKLTKDIL